MTTTATHTTTLNTCTCSDFQFSDAIGYQCTHIKTLRADSFKRPVQTIPATTDEACQKYGATAWGCSCPDSQNRGGSYIDAAGSRHCKHTHFMRSQAKPAAADIAPVVDRLFGATPKAAKPEFTTTINDCTCPARSFAAFAGDYEPCEHMAALKAAAELPAFDADMVACPEPCLCGDCCDARDRAELEASLAATTDAEIKEMMRAFEQPEPIRFAMSPARARMLAALKAAEPVQAAQTISRPINFYSASDLAEVAMDAQEAKLDDWQDFSDDPLSYEPKPKQARRTA